MNRVAGIILAAGTSSRMGEDKARLDWHGKTFLEQVRGTLKKTGANPIRIVLGANAETLPETISLPAEEFVVNKDWEKGMLSSLIAGLDSLPAETDAALVWPVDHPAVSSRLVTSLMEKLAASGKLIALPKHNHKRGHPVLFSAKLFGELRAAPLEVGARHVIRNHPDDIIEVETDEEGILLNLNHRAAYEKVLSSRPPD